MILGLKDFLKKINLNDKTMRKCEFRKINICPIHPRDVKMYSENWFVKLENGENCRSHLCAFYVKTNKTFYFDTFGGVPHKFLLSHLPITQNNIIS